MRYRVFPAPDRPLGPRLRRLLALPGFPGEAIAFGPIDLACTDDPTTAAELHRDFTGRLPVWLDLDLPPDTAPRGHKLDGIKLASLVTVPTRGRWDQIRHLTPRVALVPDVVEPPPPGREDDPPLVGPAIGYVGPIDERWDAAVPIALAEVERRFQIHLTAAAAARESVVLAERRLPNLHFLPDDRASWWRRMVAGVFPYQVGPQTAHWLPASLLKAWAAGVPTVCAPLPEVARLAPSALTATTPAEWARHVQLLVAEPEQASRLAQDAAAFVAREHAPAAVLARVEECLYALFGRSRA